MKTLLVIMLMLFGISFELKCQIIVVKKDQLNPTEKDIDTLYVKAKTVQFEFDTLYFVNQLLIQDYFNTIDKYNVLRKTTIGLIENMQDFNKKIEIDFNTLNRNVDKSFQFVRDSLAVNNFRLDKWKVENSKLMSINNQLNINLTQAKEQIRSEKWNSMGKKMLFGGGGVLVGVGISAVVILVAK